MRRTSVGIVLLTYCVLVAPLARAEHTVTPPGLSPNWMGPPSKVDPDSDAAKAARSLGVTFVDAINKGDAQAAANVVNTRAFAQRVAASMYTGVSQQSSFVDGFMASGQPMRRVFEGYIATLQRTHGSAKLMRVIMHAGPDFRRGWYALATSCVLLKDYPGAVSAFREMQTRFGAKYSPQVFVGKPGWDGFAQSDAFKKWLPQ